MPFPKINDLLPPFFDLLADGQPHTHAEIERTLAARFRLSEGELAEKTPNGLPRFTNLIAWCKAYATMAGFTEPDGRDSLRLTRLGRDEVQKGTARITVKSLTAFRR